MSIKSFMRLFGFESDTESAYKNGHKLPESSISVIKNSQPTQTSVSSQVLSSLELSNNLSSTFDEAEAINEMAILKLATEAGSSGEVFDIDVDWDNLSQETIDKLLDIALEKARTIDECEQVYDHEWTIGDFQDRVAEKQILIFNSLIASAKSVDECFEIIEDSGRYSLNVDDDEVIQPRMVELASSIEDCERIEREYDLTEEQADMLYDKWIPLLPSVESCEEFWEEAGTDSPKGRKAICRAAEIIKEAALDQA
jgi:hypothetical protein